MDLAALGEDAMSEYMTKHNIQSILSEMVESLCVEQPEDPLAYMIEFLTLKSEEKKETAWAGAFSFLKEGSAQEVEEDTEGEDSSSEQIRRRYSTVSRRAAFSAESVDVDEEFDPVMVPKSEEELVKLRAAVGSNLLFRQLDGEEREVVMGAMVAKETEAGEVVIEQGDEGDNFYVIDHGVFDVYVQGPADTHPRLVNSLKDSDSFGELALMHGTPRAATVKARTAGKLWSLDRITFRKLIARQTETKRKQYVDFLSRVPLLQSLPRYDLLTVCDALVPAEYEQSQVIVRQGEPGDSMYIIVQGEVQVEKTGEGGPRDLGILGPSSFFGERALLLDQPRAATVTARSKVKCVSLDKSAVTRLLGPCEEVFRDSLESYKATE